MDRLYALCVSLFREQGMAMAAEGGFLARAFDATAAKGPVIAPLGLRYGIIALSGTRPGSLSSSKRI